ncbi:MAG: hypothetical protein PWP23_1197 [Candidatus Sumerlaeota bacterium]|nr:hypothetical protein [Candidatus Sumerlaeota bacterium]
MKIATKFLKTCLVGGLALGLSGCLMVRTPFLPPLGSGLNQTSFPVDTTFNGSKIGTREGRAESTSVLFGLFAWGDCSASTAARNGGVDVVEQVDADLLNILTIYVKYETIVTGYSREEYEAALAQAQ